MFINDTYSCLNITTMSYRHFRYYCENILPKNSHHCEKIFSIKLSNEKPFNQIDKFFHFLSFYPNLKQLYLYSSNDCHLKLLPSLVPNLQELHVDSEKDLLSSIQWMSSMKTLEKCSINRMKNQLELVVIRKLIILIFSQILCN